jgi:hypothetical protein
MQIYIFIHAASHRISINEPHMQSYGSILKQWMDVMCECDVSTIGRLSFTPRSADGQNAIQNCPDRTGRTVDPFPCPFGIWRAAWPTRTKTLQSCRSKHLESHPHSVILFYFCNLLAAQ